MKNSKPQLRGIFIDPLLEAQFQKEGFVKIRLLDSSEISLFLEFFESIKKNLYRCEYGNCSTTDVNDPNLVLNVDQFVSQHFTPHLKAHFQNFQKILGNYWLKKPQPNSKVPLHQDWSFVDETEFYSIAVWCPLIDVNSDNGSLFVVPRTHRMSTNLRPSPSFPDAFSEVRHLLQQRVIEVPVFAGEAICFDSAVLHASPENVSGEDRPVLTFGLTHQAAQLRHYFAPERINQTNHNLLEEFVVDADFFAQHERGMRPTASQPLRTVESVFKSVSISKFESAYKEESYLRKLITRLVEY